MPMIAPHNACQPAKHCAFLKVIVLLLWVIGVSYTDRNCNMFYGSPSAFTEIAITCVSTLNKTPLAV